MPPLVKHVFSKSTTASAWVGQQVKPHVFGELPCGQPPCAPPNDKQDKS
jgi:xanthosine utilization system XapX-like protein